MALDGDSTPREWATLLVSLGYLAFGGAVAVAYANPATGYEVSIYAGTPLSVWVGLGVALFVALFGGLLAPTSPLRALSVALGVLAVAAFAALPVLRGYHYFAAADSLTHLGWVRDLAGGTLHPTDLIYPGIHSVSVLVAELAGFGLARAVMLTVASFSVLYVVFVTLTVRALTSADLGTVVGAASAFLLLPINVVVIKPTAHPISQTSLYFALIVFLFVGYLAGTSTRTRGRTLLTGVGVLLLVALASLVLYHPQGAVVVLVLFGTISVAQLFARRTVGVDRLRRYRPLYAPTVFLAGWFAYWVAAVHPALLGQARRILVQIQSALLGTGGTGRIVVRRGASLQQIGASLAEIFLKLFLVDAVYALLAAGLVLLALLGRLDEGYPALGTATKYLGVGLAVLLPWSLVQFVGPLSDLFFRYLGFVMVLATILGGCAVYLLAGGRAAAAGTTPGRARSNGGGRVAGPRARVVLLVLLVPMVAVSLATTYPSSFIYQPSGHVTEMQMDGYEAAFDHAGEGAEIVTAGTGAWRYRHAVRGTAGHEWGSMDSPPVEGGLVGMLRAGEGSRYLVVTRADRVRALQVYRGLRFSRAAFRELGSHPGVNRIASNGEVRLYQASNGAGNATRA